MGKGNENDSVGVIPEEVVDTDKVDVLEEFVERVGMMNDGDDRRVNDEGGVSANPEFVVHEIPSVAGTSLEVFPFSSPIVLPRISLVVNVVVNEFGVDMNEVNVVNDISSQNNGVNNVLGGVQDNMENLGECRVLYALSLDSSFLIEHQYG
ncbi:unnamed protein product [Ilex paraguariensis]|uniref:Uncharacterized protein n=1 Tax=Ilex paraguariensis TaxID=185542 RepID=A0ABC8U5M4_9AQUA